MNQSSGASYKVKVIRLLTLLSFFHFSGLNNGFTFMVIQAQGMQPVSFAPVAIRSLCTAVNPFIWKKSLRLRKITRFFSFSARALEISSRNAVRKYNPQVFFKDISSKTRFNSISSNESDNFLNINKEQFPQFAAESCLMTASQKIFLKSRSHISLRRTDERLPEETPDLGLGDFGVRAVLTPEDEIKVKALIERQAFLPASERLLLWHHSRGAAGDDPSEKTNFMSVAK